MDRIKLGVVGLWWYLAAASAHAAYVGLVIGDSFSTDPNEWPFQVSEAALFSEAHGGWTLVRLEQGDVGVPSYAEHLDNYLASEGINLTIIQGGVNDVIAYRPYKDADAILSDMKAATASMVQSATDRNLDYFVMNIAPWTDAPSSTEEQMILDYNAWLDLNYGDAVIDIFALLNDPSSPGNMLAMYDSDGLHPNDLGHLAIAQAVDQVLISQVPLPAVGWLVSAAVAGLIGWRRRDLS